MGAPRFFRGRRFLVETSKVEQVTVVSEDGRPQNIADRIKMIVENSTRQIVGCHICGAHAADLIQEVVTAMNAGATVDLLSSSIHGHPTLSEVTLAAARQF